MEDKLKPCPFCGGNAETMSIELMDGKEVHYVRCKDIYCCGRITRKWTDFDTAVYAWNRRKNGKE